MKKKTTEQIANEVDREWEVLEKDPKLLAMKQNFEEYCARTRKVRQFDERVRLYRSIKNDLGLLLYSARKKDPGFYDDLLCNFIDRLIQNVDKLNPVEVEEVPEAFITYSDSMECPIRPPELAELYREDDNIPF